MNEDQDWLEAYRRGHAAAKAGIRVEGAAETMAALAAARRASPRFSNEELEKFWAPLEWGILYEPPPPRRTRAPVPCPSWIDPKWWERKWLVKPAGFTDEGWADALCTIFNKIDKRGRHD
jgi:hypothetical protein